ncbi:MAG: glycoside hydrolase family 38 C-terminal domain-containing protein [Planctomycetota bacterium]
MARKRIEKRIWSVDPDRLAVIQSRAAKEHRNFAKVPADSFAPVDDYPHHWGQMFDQCWWKVSLPPAAHVPGGEQRYLYWRDQAEATVYVGGLPHYGIDPGHRYAPLPDGVNEVVIESLCARTGIWVDGESQGIDPKVGSRFDGAFLATRNDDAWHALLDLDVLMQIASLLDKPEYTPGYDMWGGGGWRAELTLADPLLRRLIDRMSKAIDLLDARGLSACREALRAIYQDFPAYPDAIKAVLTGHAHIDLVWLWPERAGEFKAVHSFANALRMIEQYPEVVFGYSQPASYEAVERRSPELMERVRKQINAGHWEPTGAMYVESDVQLPCGEALVRAFELGQAGFRDLRGEESKCVWLPDVFGYSACFPTIMAGFDVPYFYTTKLHWSGATRFPYSSFKWVGMDGSEVVSHISWNHYNQAITPGELKNCAQQHRQSAVHDEGLFPTGYGDGGGGLNEQMCERARRLSDVASMPRAEWGTIEGFFDRLAERADDLPTWRGEMYLEYHRGVQTTHSDLKAAFRAAERGLQMWEAVRCATGGGPIDEQPWKRVCFAQFHDYIPGSSIAEVYEEAVPELESIAADALTCAVKELEAASEASGKMPGAAAGAEACVFNPLPVTRRELIGDQLVELPPLAGVAVSSLEPIDTPDVQATTTRLDNGRVRVTFNPAGQIESFVVDGESIAFAQPGAGVWTFPDVPAVYDAWDIDRYTLSNGTLHDGEAKSSVSSEPNAATVAFTQSLGELGSITVGYRLEAGSAVLRLEIDLDMNAPQTLVKLAFPTQYRGREARYGGPFGSVKRPQWPGPLTNEAMFENPGSRWACVADDAEREGLMLITESKYGFGAQEGLLHVSLGRTARVTPSNTIGDTTSLGPSKDAHQYADMGSQHISLAMGRFRADAPRSEQPAVLADQLFTPVLRYQGVPLDAGLKQIEGPSSLVPCWAKPGSGQSWTLRLHETLGCRGQIRIDSNTKQITPTDLRGISHSPDDHQPGSYRVEPYGLISLNIGES